MLKLKKIAITGGIASGKSTLLHYFKEFGAYVVDADEIVSELFLQNTALRQQIIKLFGSSVIEQKRVDRAKIAKIVFSDTKILKKWEQLIHPLVIEKIKLYQSKAEKDLQNSIFIVEIPLLFEIGLEKEFDIIITVNTEDNIAKKRMKKHDFDQRMKRLMPINQKMKKSTFVIENNGSLEDFKKKAKEIYHKIES